MADGDWPENATQHGRLADNVSPQSERSSNGTAVQERRAPGSCLMSPKTFPQTHTSLPASPLDHSASHTDTRKLTDPNSNDRISFFPQAAFAERARLPNSPNNTIHPPSTQGLAQLTPSSNNHVTSPSEQLARDYWDIDQVQPGTVLFSTGPIMSKSSSGIVPNTDTGRRPSVDRSHWTTPSGIPSSDPLPDPTHSQDRDLTAYQPGHPSDPTSLVYTTGHPNNTGPGYAMGYPPYSPANAHFGPSSPRHPSFGGPSSNGAHSQGNTYPNPGSGHAYPGYRPGMPYSPYTPYQNGPGFTQYPGSPPMGAAFGPMARGFPGGYSGSSPVASGYPNSPSASSYQGSSPAGGYSPPTGAYGMHFAPYGMVSAPPMYAPATYAHAPYAHPYLSPQGHADDGPTSGMWWFMPAGAGNGPNNVQSGGAYGAQAQAQAQYVQRIGSSQQPPQPMSALLNVHSPSVPQLPAPAAFPPQSAAHSPTSLSPMATGSMPSAASPHQMYAAFRAMGLQSPPAPAARQPPPLALPPNIQPPPQPTAAPPSPVVHSPNRPTSTSKLRTSAASKTGPGGSRVTSPTATRRPWHPNPPVARSDWVMWVGNVPSDASHDELWSFFNQDTTAPEPVVTLPTRSLLPPPPSADAGSNEHSHGVSSVFLISRSNCAFVNYEEEVYLTRAVSFFNGRPLRPRDPRCPRLVCRVRRKDDDLRAGVGGQRGTGMHARWIQEQEHRVSEAGSVDGVGQDQGVDDPATSPSTYLGPASFSASPPPIPAPVDDAHKLPPDLTARPYAGDPREITGAHHSGTGSTTSSFLTRNFPKRYFILKSLTQFDLNISVERGLWATQAHNESTLDRAYRTSKDVYLIFSANKSGEWFGYARMEGPIINSQQSVSWESRGPSRSPTSPTVQRKSDAPSSEAPADPEQSTSRLLFSPSEHKFAASPSPITPGAPFPAMTRAGGQTSAPAELGEAHKQLTSPNSPDSPEHIRDSTKTAAAPVIARASEPFTLDKNAPYLAARDSSAFPTEESSRSAVDGLHDATPTTEELEHARGLSEDQTLRPIRETASPAPAVDGEERAETWGKPFKIRWIKTERLPFHRTRHLRNPWNSDREVKVSRDGTEVEPSVGQRLLDEWDRVVEPESPTVGPGNPAPARHGHLPSRPGTQSNAYGSAPLPSSAAGRGPAGRAR